MMVVREAAPAPTPQKLHEEHVEHSVDRNDLIRIALVSLAAIAAWVLRAAPPQLLVGGGAAVIGIGAWPIVREAFENLRERRMTMELSMVLALVAALAIGEVFVALVIAAFVLGAEVLEGLAVARGRHAIEDLLQYLPRTAVVRRGVSTEEIPIGELVVGDRVLVNPGTSIAVDGTVLAGSSYVDEATITGEPMPVEKLSGSLVYAGTVNQTGALEVRAERIGRDSTFGKIVEAVEHAERSRAPVQKTADRFSGYLVYLALAAATVTFLLTRDGRTTISVVIVAGACGIAAGTPLAILGGIGRAARHGSIIKGGRYLETLWGVNTVVLDKTGTLTFGTPAVQAVLPAAGESSTSLLTAAATAEARSEHPLARAILERARAAAVAVVEPERFNYTPGKGVTASLNGTEIVAGTRAWLIERGIPIDGLASVEDVSASEVVVASNARLLGSILIADTLRPEAIEAIRSLRAMDIRTVLLTGDHMGAAQAIAGQLEVDDVAGGLLPEQKRERVRALVAAGCIVAMVGDGVNDAPALAEASVGVAMGSGTDVTRESAHVVLIGNDLSKFVETLRISHRTYRVIRQNFVGTIAVDALGMALAAFGLLGPLVAAFIHVTSELAFILNAARLLPAGRRER